MNAAKVLFTKINLRNNLNSDASENKNCSIYLQNPMNCVSFLLRGAKMYEEDISAIPKIIFVEWKKRVNELILLLLLETCAAWIFNRNKFFLHALNAFCKKQLKTTWTKPRMIGCRFVFANSKTRPRDVATRNYYQQMINWVNEYFCFF